MDALRERPLIPRVHLHRSASPYSGEDSPSVDDDSTGPPGEKRHHGDYFPASKLFEYQWPLGVEGAEYYILQEQVNEFLDIRGIQRKYPDLYRRTVELDERKYLMGRGVVTEMQSNMGLVALRSEDVLELMMEDYPAKYTEYQEVMQEREFHTTLNNKIMEAKRVAVMEESRPVVQCDQSTQMAVLDTASYNSKLSEMRQNFRATCVDNQTNVVQVPRATPVVSPAPKLSRYPVALLPGQYGDHVRHYSSQELSRLPLNTVTDFSMLEDVVKPQDDPASSVLSTLSSLLPGTTPTRSSHSSMVGGAAMGTRANPSPVPNISKSNLSLPTAILSAIFSKALQGNAAITTSTTTAATTPTRTGYSSVLKSGVSSSLVPNTGTVTQERKNSDASIASQSKGAPAISGGHKSKEIPATTSTTIKTADGKLAGGSREVGGNLAGISREVGASDNDSAGEVEVVDVGGESAAESLATPLGSDASASRTAQIDRTPHGGTPPPKYKLCMICFKSRLYNKIGRAEDMIKCSSCFSSVHPSCYDLSVCTVKVAGSYTWQCLNCKKCQLCSNSSHDDQMMCCDMCDRGYHSFCVGLQQIPSGHWWCKMCTSCASCGRGSQSEMGVVMDKRGEESEEWKNEYHKGVYVQTLCGECSSYYRRGYFCPVCVKVYHNDDTDSPMVCCDMCDRWIHTDCDGISPELYAELSKEEVSTYVCSICQGKKPEKVDLYHKKYKTSVTA